MHTAVYLCLPNVLWRWITSVIQWCCGVEASIIFRSWPQKLGLYCTLKTHWTVCSRSCSYVASSRAIYTFHVSQQVHVFSLIPSICTRDAQFIHRFVKTSAPQTPPCSSHVNVLPPAHTQICTPAAFLRITTVQQPAELQGACLFFFFLNCFYYVCFGSS